MPIFPPPPPPPIKKDPFVPLGRVYLSPVLPNKRKVPETPFNLDSFRPTAVPYLPGKMSTGGTGSGTTPRDENNNTNTSVKTGTNANFTGLFFSALPNYFIQEALSLRSLTGNEILQVAHRENFYTTAEVLNRNIIDLVESRQSYSPAQIIKLQTPDYSYLFQNNPATYVVSLASSIVNISIPSSGVDKSSKIQVETFAPRQIKNDTIYV